MCLPLINIFTTITIYTDPIVANVAKTKLESEGIYCFLKNEALMGSPTLRTVIGEIELQVKEEDVDKAKKILQIGEVA